LVHKEDKMANLKIKKLIEDLENNTTQVLSTVTKAVAGAVSGTAAYATTAGRSGTAQVAVLATSAGKAASAAYAGTSRIAHYGSAGTGALA
jgi:hypothetical protein